LFINTEEVAKQLWMTPYTVRKYIRKGILQGVRIGKQYLVRQEDVDHLLKDMTAPKNQKEENA
jgi:excisionase family DNA binding protein